MEIRDFIIRSIDRIAQEIKGITMRYAHDPLTDFHIIEVEPESIRRGNDNYMEMENKLWSDFFANFPNGDLLISDVDDTNDMSNIIYRRTSDLFKSYSETSDKEYNYHINIITNHNNSLTEMEEGSYLFAA